MNPQAPPHGDDDLRPLLRDARPTAALPPRFEEAVWRRIERADLPTVERSGWFEILLSPLLQPRWVLTCLTLNLLLSGLAGIARGNQAMRTASQERYLAAVAPSSIR